MRSRYLIVKNGLKIMNLDYKKLGDYM